jgi:hypothetical protein
VGVTGLRIAASPRTARPNADERRVRTFPTVPRDRTRPNAVGVFEISVSARPTCAGDTFSTFILVSHPGTRSAR